MSSILSDAQRAADSVTNLISAGTLITGTISFSGGLRIDGEVRGNVHTTEGQSGTLIVGGSGRVDGDVAVERVIADGTITGRVCASEFIRIQSKAQVNCELEYAEIEIESGAVVEGRLSQHRSAVHSTEAPAELPIAGPTEIHEPV